MNAFENIVGKGENSSDQHCYSFQLFSYPSNPTIINLETFDWLSANVVSLVSPIFFLFGKQLSPDDQHFVVFKQCFPSLLFSHVHVFKTEDWYMVYIQLNLC